MKQNNAVQIHYYLSPCGEIILGSYNNRICLCDWPGEKRRETIDGRIRKSLQAEYVVEGSEVIFQAVSQLDEYFSGKRKEFDIPLLFIGTDFQKEVWQKLLTIPYGATVSYGELSRRLGNPKAVRAVAAANGANPISIFVPCHRVIGGNQKLTGYGGGLHAKKLLLELESPIKRLL